MTAGTLESLPFDQYQRYSLASRAVSLLRTGRDDRFRVLDVGGHAFTFDGSASILPIRLFLPEDDTVVVDIHDCQAPGYVRGSGAALPFVDGCFDVVVSCDTLEHILPLDRPAFLDELLRVSREYVVVAAPFRQPETQLADRILELYISRTLGVTHEALREHLVIEPPRREEVTSFLDSRAAAYVDFPSGYVYHWLIMMMLKHYLISLPETTEIHRMADTFYNSHLSESDDRSPAYRHVFIVSKSGRRENLQRVRRELTNQTTANPQDSNGSGSPLLDLLLDFVQLKQETGNKRDLRAEVITKDLRIADLEREAASRDIVIADLRRMLNEYHENLTATRAKLEHNENKLGEYRTGLEEARDRLIVYHENLTASAAKLEAAEAKLGYSENKLQEYRTSLEEARDRLVVYHENLTASLAKLEATEARLEAIQAEFDQFKKGRVVSAMLKAQKVANRLRGVGRGSG